MDGRQFVYKENFALPLDFLAEIARAEAEGTDFVKWCTSRGNCYYAVRRTGTRGDGSTWVRYDIYVNPGD